MLKDIQHDQELASTGSPLRRGLRRITAATTIFFFFTTFYFIPTAWAIENAIETNEANSQFQPQGENDEARLSNTLQAIKEGVADTKATVDKRMQEESGLIDVLLNLLGLSNLQNESLEKLLSMSRQMEILHEKALANFAEIEAMLIAKGLPEEILQRHYDAVSRYKADYAELHLYIQKCVVAESLHDQQEAMDKLNTFLQAQQFKRSHQRDDPNNLPFGNPRSEDTREPFTDSQQLGDLIHGKSETRIVEKVLDTLIKPAQAQLPDNPTPDDLAETIDVRLSDAIRAKALELNNDPVQIYTWVHNNIRFIPSYGSIQGADYTLQNGKGNAVDTASLLIALLRSSGIPARYSYGTIKVPVDQVMNWVGGVNVPGAAQQLLGQGGIPNIAQVSGGNITHIKMEHTWVEAWVDFEPSRGIKNIQGDAWVPMDASFKQYEFTEEVDVRSQVTFDAQAFTDALTANTETNETEGWVRGLPESQIESEIESVRSQIETFIDNQNPGSNDLAAIYDSLGFSDIKIKAPAPLAAGLPYELVLAKDNFSGVPDNLRYKFKFELRNSPLGFTAGTVFSIEKSTPELAGKSLALSFDAASVADEEFLKSFVPEPGPGGEILESQFDIDLPGYLINVKGQFSINGEIVTEGGKFTIGTELASTIGLWSPSFGWSESENKLIAGEYIAVALDLQGVARNQLEMLEDQVVLLRDRVNDPNATTGLTDHEIVGTFYQSAIYSYFAFNDNIDEVTSRIARVVKYRAPSYGVFQNSIETQFLFGFIPRNVSFAGLSIDVDRLYSTSAEKNNIEENWINYNGNSGIGASALEHIIPELFFADDGIEGISAVKALRIASSLGQKIFTIDQSNAAFAISNLTLDADIRTEIQAAINVGKQVVVHENPVNLSGWIGFGYIISDLETGAAAYKISGGYNGGGVPTGPKYLSKIMSQINPEAIPNVASLNKWANKSFSIFGSFFNALEVAEACPPGEAIAVAIINRYVSAFLTNFILGSLLAGPVGIIFAIVAIVLVAILTSFITGLITQAAIWNCRNR